MRNHPVGIIEALGKKATMKSKRSTGTEDRDAYGMTRKGGE